MFTNPNYFNIINSFSTSEVMEVLSSFESNFRQLSSDRHINQIEEILDNPKDLPTKDIRDGILDIYRSHIADIFSKLGITLFNPLNEKLSILDKLLTAITILSTSNLEETLEGIELDPNEDSVIYLSDIFEYLTDLQVPEILSVIANVDSELIKVLDKEEDLESFKSSIINRAKERFKKELNENRDGVVADFIRRTNSFGYILTIANNGLINSLMDDLNEIRDDKKLAKEIRLLVLGSSATGIELELMANEITNLIIEEDPIRLLSVNAKIGNFQEYLK